jgi:hypothetical protein
VGSLPRRCNRYSVGKDIGGSVYVHRMYEGLLPTFARTASTHLPADFDYTVVKFSERDLCVSFVLSPDFDVADEPVVSDIIRIDAGGSSRKFLQQADPFIYHHKWLFVLDDYKRFDVSRSKSRSISWLAIEGIDMTRIGRKRYWTNEVLPRIPTNPTNWLSSSEVLQELKITSCELSHLRNAGSVRCVRLGNTYYYDVDSFSQDPD